MFAARRLAAASGGSAVAGAAWLSYDVDNGPSRAARSLGYGLLIGCDYKWGPAARLEKESAEYRPALSATHARSAERLLGVCLAHGGLYNKLGQYLASMTVALPPEYPRALAACQDRARPVPLSDVRWVVESQLGGSLEVLFASFEPEPVAAASLAQVRRTAPWGEGGEGGGWRGKGGEGREAWSQPQPREPRSTAL